MIDGRRTGSRLVAPVLLAALVLSGIWLRVAGWRDRPAGPYVDEVDFLRLGRAQAAAPGRFDLFGTTPLQTPETGFVSNVATNLHLALVGAVDRAAGGGLASLRAMSIAPAILVFLAGLAIAREGARHEPGRLVVGAILLASSMALLVPGRWACDVVGASALLAVAAALGLAADRRRSAPLAFIAGAALGLALYFYVAARLGLVFTALLAVFFTISRERERALRAAVTLLAALAVSAPLLAHFARHPERATARTAELAVWRRPLPAAVAALGANLRDHAELFLLRGDANERHGDPARPVVPPLVAGLALAGAAAGLRRSNVERFLLGAFLTFLAGGLVARSAPPATFDANANRISAGIPFLLVLAALGGARLVNALPAARRRLGATLLGAGLVVTAALDVSAFERWTVSPRTWGALGGPERELADAIAAAAARAPADALLGPGSARDPYVVDVLLGRPGEPGHAVRLGSVANANGWRFQPSRDVLYATEDEGEAAAVTARLGGREEARGRDREGNLWWVLVRIPGAAARAEARQALDRAPLLPARATGNVVAAEEGLYLFVSQAGTAAARLAPGRHAVSPVGLVRVVYPDGFARRTEEALEAAPR